MEYASTIIDTCLEIAEAARAAEDSPALIAAARAARAIHSEAEAAAEAVAEYFAIPIGERAAGPLSLACGVIFVAAPRLCHVSNVARARAEAEAAGDPEAAAGSAAEALAEAAEALAQALAVLIAETARARAGDIVGLAAARAGDPEAARAAEALDW